MKLAKTSIRLADGRELIYFDEREGIDRHVPDTRDLAAAVTSSQIRRDPLRDEWVVIASHRQGRTHLPPADQCPLCPSRGGRATEIPADDYDVVVFENRFPSLAPDPGPVADAGPFQRQPGVGRCEVVCFTADHDGALEANGWHSIIVSGGSFRTPSDALVGPFANQTLRQLNADLLLLGVHSIDARVGLTTPNVAEAETNRIMVAGARRVAVVADSSKLGQVSLATFAGCDEVAELVTDSGADQATLGALADTGLRIQLVDPRPQRRRAMVAAS